MGHLDDYPDAYPVTNYEFDAFLLTLPDYQVEVDGADFKGMSRTYAQRCLMLLFKAGYVKPSINTPGHWIATNAYMLSARFQQSESIKMLFIQILDHHPSSSITISIR